MQGTHKQQPQINNTKTKNHIITHTQDGNHIDSHFIMNRFVVILLTATAMVMSSAQAQQSTLPPLTIVGAEGSLTDADFPLSKCQGDCNRNADCDGDLLCFSRGGATSIPGCSGRAENDGTDYCWDPTDKPSEGVIAHVGNNGNPAVLFPLPRCAGQCASDADCQSGLVCHLRDRVDDPVYGCEGPLLDRVDYCINPGDIPGSTVGTPTPTKDDTATTTETETGTTANTTTDGGIGVDGEDEIDIEPLVGLLEILYLGGAADPNATEPLAECQGHCGLDVPCADGLTCVNRTGSNATVPGCGGILLPNIHYCVSDVTAEPLDDIELDHPSLVGKLVVAIYEGFPYESLPLKHCQGDCKSHDMCDQENAEIGKMSCYVREDGTGEVPGCTGIPVNDIAYCVKASDLAKPAEDEKSAAGAGHRITLLSFWWTLSAILPALAASAMVCYE